MRGLEGKRAIVTGGAQGIGRACVEALLGHGAQVTFCDMGENGVATQQELGGEAKGVFYIFGDMSSEAFCEELVAYAAEKMGGVDLLVNNAFSFVAEGMNATREHWLRVMEVGVFGFAKMTQLVAPHMEQAGGGAIVNLSSISAHIAQPDRWTYNAAKGGVDQLTKCSALDLAPKGIRINSVSPGWIWTPAVDAAAGGDREKFDPIWGKYHMLRRCGFPEEVASAVAFLLSQEASFITGTDLPVDGGYLGLGGEGLGELSEAPNKD